MRFLFKPAITGLLAVLAATSTLSGQQSSAAGSSAVSAADRTAVQNFVRAYIKAHNDADATAMMDAMNRDPSTSSISDGEITRGWEAIRTETDEVTGAEGRFRVSVGTMDVTALGAGHVLVIAPTSITVATDKGPLQLKGAVTLVLRKTGAKWTILHEHYSTVAAGAEG